MHISESMLKGQVKTAGELRAERAAMISTEWMHNLQTVRQLEGKVKDHASEKERLQDQVNDLLGQVKEVEKELEGLMILRGQIYADIESTRQDIKRRDVLWQERRSSMLEKVRQMETLRVEAIGGKEREDFALDTRISNMKRLLEQKCSENEVLEAEIKKMESTLIKLEEKEKSHKAVLFEGACRVSAALENARRIREAMLGN
jgi:peptidoglycan hydrolase CwlO-like protein